MVKDNARLCLRLLGGIPVSSLLGFLRSTSFKASLGAALAGLGLLFQSLLLYFLGFHVVDGFRENTLVFELVTLGEHVKRVVDVLVDFLGVPHLLEQTTEHACTAHP